MKPHACQTSPEVTFRCLALKIQDVTLTEVARVHIYICTHKPTVCVMSDVKDRKDTQSIDISD